LGKSNVITANVSLERPAPVIESCILLIRGQKVLLDGDLAALYGVATGRLNEAVKRNRERFPDDFMFELTLEEGKGVESLRSQIAILDEAESKSERGRHRKYAPYVFTEQGIAMLSSVLRSPRAIQVNIAIVRTFVRLRRLLAAHEEIAEKLETLEWRQNEQGQQIRAVFETIEQLMKPTEKETERRRIGFPVSRAGQAAAGSGARL
jgi:phage regulator Rha-like protein